MGVDAGRFDYDAGYWTARLASRMMTGTESSQKHGRAVVRGERPWNCSTNLNHESNQ
jgi:hypothetical protein